MSLIGTTHLPALYEAARREARRGRDYYALMTDEYWRQRGWKTEERGLFPVCLPFTRHITDKGATWLWGRPASFACDKDGVTDLVNEAWAANRMSHRMVAIARGAGQSGGVVLKWEWKEGVGVSIQDLDVQYVRLYWDPHVYDKLLMARVQYPYKDLATGNWMWYREDWTAEEHVIYEPEAAPSGLESQYLLAEQFDTKEFKVKERKANEARVIPLTLIRNFDAGGDYGQGDLWGLFRIVDEINLAHDIAKKDNLLSVWPRQVNIDIESYDEDAPTGATVGGVEDLKTIKDSPSQGKVMLLERTSSVRESLKAFTDELTRCLYDAAGSVLVRAEDITNKGALTRAVMSQIYAPLIEHTELKRSSWGENGVCRFFENMSTGLANLGQKGWVDGVDVQIHWPPYFELTEDDLAALVSRKKTMVDARFTTQERAVTDVAVAEGVEDIDALQSEIAALPAEEIAEEPSTNATNQE